MTNTLIDLTGQRFGKLVVLQKGEPRITPNGTYFTRWLCQCDCGNTALVDTHKLRSGHTTSCGCAKRLIRPSKKNLEGQRFGKLTVIRFLEPNEREHPHREWLCQCDCGNQCQVGGNKLISGATTSCGCRVVERIGNLNRKYQHTNKRLYSVWQSVLSRCYAPNSREYANYGGRGIDVCPAWRDPNTGFDVFYDWAVKSGYDFDAKHGACTIDRIDVNAGYSPDNCRWISNTEQQNNKRGNILLEYRGEIHTMAEWSDMLGVPYSTLRYHIQQKHRTLDDVVHKRF